MKNTWLLYCPQVRRVIRHPDYNRNTLDYDYAIVELSDSIPLTGDDSKARAACLPSADADVSGADFTVSGWGTLQAGGESPGVLHSVVVPHVSDATCQENYDTYGYDITDQMICAGKAEGMVDSCQGDSGGIIRTGFLPLLISVDPVH